MKIALIGDSHTQVTFPILREKLTNDGHDVVEMVSNAGWSEDTYLSNPYEIYRITDKKPDTIIVALGGNNQELSDDKYEYTVNALLNRLGFFDGTKIIWVSPAYAKDVGVNHRHEWTTNWLLSHMKNMVVIDSRPYTQTNHRADGVHFDRVGYSTWVDGIYPQIKGAIRYPIVLYKVRERLPMITIGVSVLLLGYTLWRRYGNTR
jgi:lysophospholipase L1-like esterase